MRRTGLPYVTTKTRTRQVRRKYRYPRYLSRYNLVFFNDGTCRYLCYLPLLFLKIPADTARWERILLSINSTITALFCIWKWMWYQKNLIHSMTWCMIESFWIQISDFTNTCWCCVLETHFVVGQQHITTTLLHVKMNVMSKFVINNMT